MAEVIRVFDDTVSLEGETYRVQVCGRPVGNIWEGWIEFVATDEDVLCSPRETTQPDRNALEYWASGLSLTYLEGALARALQPPVTAPRSVVAKPHFDGPAPSVVPEPVVADRAILDPFAVGAKGEELLRRELGALRGWHLRNIVRVYELADQSVDLEALSKQQLVELIVAAVEPV